MMKKQVKVKNVQLPDECSMQLCANHFWLVVTKGNIWIMVRNWRIGASGGSARRKTIVGQFPIVAITTIPLSRSTYFHYTFIHTQIYFSTLEMAPCTKTCVFVKFIGGRGIKPIYESLFSKSCIFWRAFGNINFMIK